MNVSTSFIGASLASYRPDHSDIEILAKSENWEDIIFPGSVGLASN